MAINDMEKENKKIKTNKKIKIFLISVVLISTFCLIKNAKAADLYFSPAVGIYKVGDNLITNLFVDTSDQAINAVSAEISFPADMLEVTSLSKTNSIFNFWLQEPSFSNQTGKINIDGVVLNPGFNGIAGKIIGITFKIKKSGQTKFLFNSASVLANDGKATNILEKLNDTNFIFNTEGVGAQESTTPITTPNSPIAPQINSSTHPDPNRWYLNKNAKFSWSVPSDIIAVKFIHDKYPSTVPATKEIASNVVSNANFSNIADGIWYFHLQLKNNNGWGSVTHFRFQIDTQVPAQFSIEKLGGDDCLEYPQPTFNFGTKDSLSGINNYKIKIDGGNYIVISPDLIKEGYKVDKQKPGNHIIIVEALDKAGNYTSASKEFCIKSLVAPQFTKYPITLDPKEPLIVSGLATPNANVKIYLQYSSNQPVETSVKANSDGNFSFVADHALQGGLYKIWAQSIDLTGAISNISDQITFSVEDPAPLRIGKTVINYMTIIITLIALLLLLLIIIYLFYKRYRNWKKRIVAETEETETGLHDAFSYLREEIEKQVERFDNQEGLNSREKEIYDNLKRSLEVSEKMILKDVKEIKREVN